MKADVYMVCIQNQWKAAWTLELQTDMAFWQHEWREEAVMWRWDAKLPLSLAEEAVSRWHEGEGDEREQGESLRLMQRCIEAALLANEKGSCKGGAFRRVDLQLTETRGAAAVPEHVLQAVAARLQGRATLAGEALALLAASSELACVAIAAGGWSALAPALQLASLRGLLRLRSAVAPLPPPASPWRRLLPAPLRRGRPWRRRCLRCGSGEARMNRTACAACGSSACAYCEACLTMGRSRECGLLILGGGDSRLADAHGAASAGRLAAPGFAAARAAAAPAPSAEPSPRWGLSPAQHAAASAALRYARPRLAALAAAAGTAAQDAPRSEAGAWPSLPGRVPAAAVQWPIADRARPPEPACPSLPGRVTATATQWATANRAHPPQSACPSPPGHLPTTAESPSLPPIALAPSSAHSPSQPAAPFLLWAVTGAGKTEMIFPLIEAALATGGRALIATPRRDVVLELDPRIRRAFPEASVATLYGGSDQRWEDGQITLATTHQLFRLHERFELVVVDELDAFPFHGDPLLYYAASKAGKPGGATILLSATPPAHLQRAARKQLIEYARVPVRFHRHPLPVPAYLRMPRVAQVLARQSIPDLLRRKLQASIDRGAQCFIFVQQIRHAEPLAALLRRAMPNLPIGATSSQDAERSEHVVMFRERKLRMLVTTTILERGVTVPNSDVFILDADGKLFDEASLVQMSGRAGRSKDDPAGRVYFCASNRSEPQRRAIKQITSMNKEASVRGFLLPSAERARPPKASHSQQQSTRPISKRGRLR
ncbi:helicase domain protein [Paenibacillus curdlanolyticus YK9]|uniref:Helicase domain protein n=1 Tax=Paenibacillus curdlanolyticus YK9 TaxID=717606 RepID=E0IED8_9BACL|nr:helicase-related protein [Paenibacillus curdlanolyticus]EFM09026.1 helicase domain protein [Paenibacillus curdlanolyticus YK9]